MDGGGGWRREGLGDGEGVREKETVAGDEAGKKKREGKRGREVGRYLSDVAIPVLRPNADFYCFLHEAGGDDHRVDGSLCCAGRHD
jgi:hypothetical protein